MSLPLHLQNIKSSGVYRFVFDKSEIPPQVQDTLRLLVGYSEKGPFNTPVYVDTREKFITTFGNISKRLEKKGVFFHRLALQALAEGPILCLNLKPFDNETVKGTTFNASEAYTYNSETAADVKVTSLYNTNRFWTLDADELPGKISSSKFITLFATDTVDASCSVIIRPVRPEQYDLSIREWYAGVSDEMPDYLAPIQDDKLNKYFADVYVFRGQFTSDLCGPDGPLGKYFNVNNGVVTLEENYTDAFGEPADVLTALANDPASNYVAGYRGTSIPYFKGTNGNYLSLDLLFNSGYSDHKMLMKLDESMLDEFNVGTTNPTDIQKIHSILQFPTPIDPDDSSDSNVDTITYSQKAEQKTYYKKTSSGEPVTYSYAVATDLTDEQKAGATRVDAVPTTGVSANSPNYIYIVTGYSYTPISDTDLTKSQIKKAVEVNPVPATVTADSPAIIKYTTVNEESISPCYLAGYTYATLANESDYTHPCVSVITGEYGKGLQEALTNRIDSEYHYLVDTFDTNLEYGATDKMTLAALAKKKDNAFAIINFPKIKRFIDAGMYNTNNTLDFGKVVKGVGQFVLPDDNDGASWAGYFTQVVVSDGTVKTTIPSAGLVSNRFQDKWMNRQPYYIVAGSQYGRLELGTLVGPDYSFSKTDRDYLEPYGINVIVYEPRRGTYINSEQTAKQVPVSALSKIHIRELVIYLQDEIADLLESYRWELNTPGLRLTIKNKADSILEQVKNNSGIYDYLNVCDDSNNTPETIDNEFLVLDTHIEPARGSSRMIEQLYIYRTGEMRSVLVQG